MGSIACCCSKDKSSQRDTSRNIINSPMKQQQSKLIASTNSPKRYRIKYGFCREIQVEKTIQNSTIMMRRALEQNITNVSIVQYA